MPTNYSLESQSEKIHNTKTKKAFKEVLSSYWSENYRSATVVLWTVTVYDLLLKLEESASIFEDENSQKKLQITKNSIQTKPTDSSWEIELAKFFRDTHKMLTEKEFEDIQRIQKDRHMCAHPTFNHLALEDEIDLYSPTQEQTKCHIRSALDAILTKPPLASRNILHIILNDLATNKNIFINPQTLERYLTSKYIKRSTKDQQQTIIRGLWKMTFKCEDKNSTNNRDINTAALEILISKSKNETAQSISSDRTHFNNITHDRKISQNLSKLIAKNFYIWDYLTEDNKIVIKSHISEAYGYNPIMWIIDGSITDKLKNLKENPSEYISDDGTYGRATGKEKNVINPELIGLLLAHDDSKEPIPELVIWAYENSQSYQTSDRIMSEYILPQKEHITIDIIKRIATAYTTNRQTQFLTNQAQEELREIIANKFKETFNTEEHQSFSEYINLTPKTHSTF